MDKDKVKLPKLRSLTPEPETPEVSIRTATFDEDRALLIDLISLRFGMPYIEIFLGARQQIHWEISDRRLRRIPRSGQTIEFSTIDVDLLQVYKNDYVLLAGYDAKLPLMTFCRSKNYFLIPKSAFASRDDRAKFERLFPTYKTVDCSK